MGKGQAVRLTEQSTHVSRGKQVLHKSVSRTLLELKEKAKRERKYRFRSLYREIDLQMLYDSFTLLKRKAASGTDGVDYSKYEENLESNLLDLYKRLRSQSYRSKLIRRKHISKGNGKTRPLGIPCLEDKIVQMSARRLLESIYEADFSDNSMGYRPGRGAREASKQLRDRLFLGHTHWIVEADIKGFFDNMNHRWLIRMLKERINDSHFLRLIGKWLRAGILEEDGVILNPTTGTPQGGIISPVLANIYLHYVLDLWVEKAMRKRLRGEIIYQRYADDFVVGFQYGYEAESFFAQLKERLGKFGLALALDKSGVIRFSRYSMRGRGCSGKFTYLGFDYYWSRTHGGKQTIKRRTNTKKFQHALRQLKTWLLEHRSNSLRQLAPTIRSKLQGHFRYYGVIGNSQRMSEFYNASRWTLYRVLNNRSQMRSYNWETFTQMWKTLDMPKPKILESIEPKQACLL